MTEGFCMKLVLIPKAASGHKGLPLLALLGLEGWPHQLCWKDLPESLTCLSFPLHELPLAPGLLLAVKVLRVTDP